MDASSNNLSSIDLSKNVGLTKLNVSGNKLTTIDTKKNLELTNLDVARNNIRSIDVSLNTKITHLSIYTNKISEIDLSNNTELVRLSIHNNLLVGLDLSLNTKLKELYASSNQLISLDLSNNKDIHTLNLRKNKLINLNIKNGNRFSKFFSSELDFTDNPNLTCIQVNNKTYSETSWKNQKDEFASYQENCDEISINSFSTATGNWNEASNWSLGHIPNSTDPIVIIPSAANVSINTNATIKNLVLLGKLSVANISALQMTIHEEFRVLKWNIES